MRCTAARNAWRVEDVLQDRDAQDHIKAFTGIQHRQILDKKSALLGNALPGSPPPRLGNHGGTQIDAGDLGAARGEHAASSGRCHSRHPALLFPGGSCNHCSRASLLAVGEWPCCSTRAFRTSIRPRVPSSSAAKRRARLLPVGRRLASGRVREFRDAHHDHDLRSFSACKGRGQRRISCDCGVQPTASGPIAAVEAWRRAPRRHVFLLRYYQSLFGHHRQGAEDPQQ